MHFSAALDKLKQGNKRFVSGLRSIDAIAATSGKRQDLADKGQKPFAMVLSCADSRAPSEMIFDCGLGELFVVRVAGNIVAPSLIGSLEFAAENFGTSLLVVMGHSKCGAVAASVDCVQTKSRPESDNVQNIVLEIAPSVRKSIEQVGSRDKDQLIKTCTTLNVDHSVEMLQERSAVLSKLVSQGKLLILGAVYDLHTGEVSFHEVDALGDHKHHSSTSPKLRNGAAPIRASL